MVKSKFITIVIVAFVFFGCSENKPDSVSNSDGTATRLTTIKESIVPFFKPMEIREYDWLTSFHEDGQTFEEYIASNPTLPNAERRTIYIQPIGEFTETQQKILKLTADYMKAFYNLPVKLNDIKAFENLPKGVSRKNPYDGQKQLKTSYFLDKLLPSLLPDDAAAFICFTNLDLFPDEKWNYVFGQAMLKTRVGVWSLWRFGNPDKSAEDFQLFLARTLKVAMHETGHMFSIQHCTKYECLMSGANHLGETDRRPLDVCPEDMAKIAWAMKYDPKLRYQNLARFWELQRSDNLAGDFKDKEKAVSDALKE